MQRLYIHQQPSWPSFEWRQEELADKVAEVRYLQGRLVGRVASVGFRSSRDLMLDTLTADVVKSSEIEGEILEIERVRSSVARQLGLDFGGLLLPDPNVDGVVEMILDATQNYEQPLTAERLLNWHFSLFPSGKSGTMGITVGNWRDDRGGPMQVVSGPIGREVVHYEAPAAARIKPEMEKFLDWFNEPPDTDPVLKAGLAHLWFVNIHPFDDGNGRIARAIGDMALARSEGSSQRSYSMSSQIRLERNDYYDILERTGKGNTDVTGWMAWFVGCLGRALETAAGSLDAVLAKARFWERTADITINERQRKVMNLLLGDFQGSLTSSRWARITRCSQDTAGRDINSLMDHGILVRGPEGGRSTNYVLVKNW